MFPFEGLFDLVDDEVGDVRLQLSALEMGFEGQLQDGLVVKAERPVRVRVTGELESSRTAKSFH